MTKKDILENTTDESKPNADELKNLQAEVSRLQI
jgi:hypothetical protein